MQADPGGFGTSLNKEHKGAMQSLLKHLVEITGHRDHNLLDISVLSALHELVGARQARTLEIFKFRDQLYIRPRVWLQDGRIASSEENLEAEQPGEPLSSYPWLLSAIEQHQHSVEKTADDGSHLVWLPLWLNDKISGCLEIRSAEPLSRRGAQHDGRHPARLSQFPEPARLQRARFADRPPEPQDLR